MKNKPPDKNSLINQLLNIKTFNKSDTDILLKMPFREHKKYLLSLVSLDETTATLIDLIYSKGLTIDEASKCFKSKSIKNEFDTLSVKSVSNYLASAKEKMFDVWSVNETARMYLELLKLNEIIKKLKI